MWDGSSVGEPEGAPDPAPRPPARPPISVLVVDSANLARWDVVGLIINDRRLELCGAAADGDEALEVLAAGLPPDLVLLDAFTPRGDGAQVVTSVKQSGLAVKLLLLTARPDPSIHDALLAGPDSLLYKNHLATPRELGDEIVGLVAGRADTPGQDLLRRAVQVAEDRPDLTRSELRVLRRAAAGESAKQIAARLDLSRGYVENQLGRIHDKLHVTSTTHAVTKAIEVGLLSVGSWPPTK